MNISIHALREEGDLGQQYAGGTVGDFYPRPPRGGRRGSTSRQRRKVDYFYPRPPRGGRPLLPASRYAYNLFLSTPSARRATGLILFCVRR